MVKFLIIRFSSIGDIVLTTPIVRMLKTQVEEAEIHYLTKKQYASILLSNPYIDSVHTLSDDFKQTINELKYLHFNHIIDLHNSLRSRRIKTNLPVYAQTFKKLNWEKWLFVNCKINKLPKIHIVDRYLDTIKIFNIKNDNKGLDFFIEKKDIINKGDLPTPYNKQYLLFAIGAQHSTKRLPPEKIISICNKIKLPILLAGGKTDFEIAEQICSKVTQPILNTCGKYNLAQSASLVQQAEIVISHDTGLMHIAAAFQKKIISIWGNTTPKFGMYPYLAHEKSVQIQTNIKCRPCSKIGFNQCPKKHFDCMNKIDEDKIIEAIQ